MQGGAGYAARGAKRRKGESSFIPSVYSLEQSEVELEAPKCEFSEYERRSEIYYYVALEKTGRRE